MSTSPGLSATPVRKVTATNDSVAGYTADAVLRQLTSDQDVIAHVRGADSVAIEVGANDVAHSAACGPLLDYYSYDETHYLSDDGDHPNAAGHHASDRAPRAVDDGTAWDMTGR